jgi:hypothetical protein
LSIHPSFRLSVAVASDGLVVGGAELAEQDLGAAFLDADQGGDLPAGQPRPCAGALLGDQLGDGRPRIARTGGARRVRFPPLVEWQ